MLYVLCSSSSAVLRVVCVMLFGVVCMVYVVVASMLYVVCCMVYGVCSIM